MADQTHPFSISRTASWGIALPLTAAVLARAGHFGGIRTEYSQGGGHHRNPCDCGRMSCLRRRCLPIRSGGGNALGCSGVWRSGRLGRRHFASEISGDQRHFRRGPSWGPVAHTGRGGAHGAGARARRRPDHRCMGAHGAVPTQHARESQRATPDGTVGFQRDHGRAGRPVRRHRGLPLMRRGPAFWAFAKSGPHPGNDHQGSACCRSGPLRERQHGPEALSLSVSLSVGSLYAGA